MPPTTSTTAITTTTTTTTSTTLFERCGWLPEVSYLEGQGQPQNPLHRFFSFRAFENLFSCVYSYSRPPATIQSSTGYFVFTSVCMFVDRPTCKYVSRVGCDIYGPDVPEPGAVLQTKILVEVHAEYMYYRMGQKTRGHRLMTILLSNLNRFQFFSLEDSLVNLQLNGY